MATVNPVSRKKKFLAPLISLYKITPQRSEKMGGPQFEIGNETAWLSTLVARK
jgi:hypothetical protein